MGRPYNFRLNVGCGPNYTRLKSTFSARSWGMQARIASS